MMWCARARKYVLDPEHRAAWPTAVLQHVEKCEECRRFVERTARLRALFAAEKPPAADEAAIARIMHEVRRLNAAPRAENLADEASRWHPLWAARLAAAAALLILLAVRVADGPQRTSVGRDVSVESAPVVELPMAPVVAVPEPVMPPPRPLAPPAPIGIRTVPPPAWHGQPAVVAASSNAGSGVEFGGLQVMPVSYDY